MTTDEKLAAILAAVQTDPGNRGLARDPHDNLFTATKGDFEAACRRIAENPTAAIHLVTGFYIPTATPPGGETDGPLGAVFLARALALSDRAFSIGTEPYCSSAVMSGLREAVGTSSFEYMRRTAPNELDCFVFSDWLMDCHPPILLAIEYAGPTQNGKVYSMRGRDISEWTSPIYDAFSRSEIYKRFCSIGIGDGGNEIGMGKIPHETIMKNIPNGDLIHCRVPTDHLIVAGVSNWGAYALAAGVFVLKGVTPPADLFDPDREQEILEVMVREGPLVDGVTGKQTATVDGLTWDEYVKPLVRIGEILKS